MAPWGCRVYGLSCFGSLRYPGLELSGAKAKVYRFGCRSYVSPPQVPVEGPSSTRTTLQGTGIDMYVL